MNVEGRALILLAAMIPAMALADDKTDKTEKKVDNQQHGDNISGYTEGETYTPVIHGTIRGKYEYQTQEGEGRFEVRNARVSVEGNVLPSVSYKAEIDLSDEGEIKMLDAFASVKPWQGVYISAGQMRVPFTIDAHRSPHKQYFANRSFIAKQVGNVRDVGVTAEYILPTSLPIILEAGAYNGRTILTDQKNSWRKGVSYSAKAQLFPVKGFNITLGVQGMKPTTVNQTSYDAGMYYENDRLHIEAEYLYKTYADNAYKDVQSVNTFVSYGIPVKRIFKRISFLARYDFMTDQWDGKTFGKTADGDVDYSQIVTSDAKRSRVTGGMTFSLGGPFQTDLRLNFEKYFYGSRKALAKASEKDKVVLELMIRF